MQLTKLSKFFAICVSSALLTANGLPAAYAAGPADQAVRVRGTVVALTGDQLQVQSREGKAITVTLKTGWTASAVAKASINDIKPGVMVQ